MPRQAKSTSAAFTVSAPPSSLSFASDHTAVSVPCCVSGATSCAGNSSSAFASGPEHGVSRSSTSVAPASLVDQNSQNELFRGFLAFMRNQEVVSTAASSLASAQSDTDTRLVYTSAPSDRPFSAVGTTPPGPPTLPAPVRGSGAGGGWGQQGRPPIRGWSSFVPARLPYAGVFPSREEDRSWGAHPSWGDFGGRAPTAVGDQSYLGPVYGEYLGYPSDPYRPHTFEQPPPSDFGPEYDFLDPFASPEDDSSGDAGNYRGVDPRLVDKEARTLLYRYMGDLYRDAIDTSGELSHGAGSELGGWNSAQSSGLFHGAPRRLGINLPSEFAAEISRMDKSDDFKCTPQGSNNTFLFNEPGHSKFFGPKRLAPETVAFSNSLRDPVSVNKSPLESKEFKKEFFHWSFVDRASSLAGRLAIYAAALTDILIRAVELEVSEEDLASVRALILEISAMQFSQAARLRLYATDRNRALTLNSLGLTDRMNLSAAVRIPRDGEFLFGGKLLDGVDSDISMHKRAREVAGRIARPRFRYASRGQRFQPVTSFSSRGRAQPFRARGRGFRRPVRGRGAAFGRGTPVWSAASVANRK